MTKKNPQYHTRATAKLKRHMRSIKTSITRDENKADAILRQLHDLNQEISDNKNLITELQKTTTRIDNIVKSTHDNLPHLRERLLSVRESKEYAKVYSNSRPLISIRIATHNRAKVLMERTIPSILNQTYENWEVIIVGDHSTDDTEQRIKELNHPRITFINEPFGFPYPDDPLYKHMVAGATVMNSAAQLAAGDWIAPIDDDDEFTPDHLEVLLEHALSGKFEMVYGKVLQHNTKTGKDLEIWSSPPQKAKVAVQGFLYLKQLNFFEYDIRSWVVEEYGDWNFCRRMLEAGVKIGVTDKVVAKLYYEPKF